MVKLIYCNFLNYLNIKLDSYRDQIIQETEKRQ